MTMLSNIVLFFLANISHCRLMRFYKWKNNQGAKVSKLFYVSWYFINFVLPFNQKTFHHEYFCVTEYG